VKTLRAWFGSVRGRITGIVTALFALVMVFGSWFLLARAEAAWIEDLKAQDLAELEMLAGDLQAFDLLMEEVILPVGEGGTSFSLVDESGLLVGQTPDVVFSSGVIVGGPIPPGNGPLDFVEGPLDLGESGTSDQLTTVTFPVELASGTLTLIASSSLEPVEAGVDSMREILWLVVPLLVAGVGAMTWFVTGRAFRPVAAITDQVERISDDRLAERVPVPSSRDEVAHLARTMNTMLNRLSSSRHRQNQFVSDASHELRNPIATSKTKLEVALAHPEDTDWEETAQVVLEEQDRLGSLVDDLLLLARLDEGKPPEWQETDLDDIIFAEVARHHRVAIDVSAVEPVRVSGDPRQLTRLVGNLLHNAVRHARKQVAVSLATAGQTAVLTVNDDGPGISEEDRIRIFERFVRLEDARSRDAGGAGLGLALVHAVATAHGGTVRVVEGESGGAQFEVHLPA
jgi:signal transduction histidine kinase